MSEPSYEAGIWDHGDPSWQLAELVRGEIGIYHAVRALARSPGGVARKRVTHNKGQRTVTETLRPLTFTENLVGEPADIQLHAVQKRLVPDNPNRPNGEAPIVVRHELVIMERVDGEMFPTGLHISPDLHTRRPPGGDLDITLAEPAELMGVDLYPALLGQAPHLGYLSMALAQCNLDVPEALR